MIFITSGFLYGFVFHHLSQSKRKSSSRQGHNTYRNRTIGKNNDDRKITITVAVS
jgi:hypothetical protein